MDEPLVRTEIADSDPQRRPGPWKLIAIVVVLTLIGVWLVPDDAPEDQLDTQPVARGDIPPAEVRDSAPSLLSEGPADDPAPVETDPAIEAVDDRPGGKARALIAEMRAEGDIQLDEVFAAAQQAQADGEMADAYLLYFFAAREGHAASALSLGTQADPAQYNPRDSVFDAPDIIQAHKWYEAAAQSGNAQGRERLADLRQRIEQLAADGDPQAQRISLIWQ
jgi:TPR repeat protein